MEWALDELAHRFVDRATTSRIYEMFFSAKFSTFRAEADVMESPELDALQRFCVQVTGVADAAQSDISHRYAFMRSYHTTVFG
jgi:hypothetical protein